MKTVNPTFSFPYVLKHINFAARMTGHILPKPDKKFFITWLITFITMYGLSYFWHGVILNDFLKLAYPKDLFLIVSAFVYFGIALGITLLTYVMKKLKDTFKYGVGVGVVVGVFIYAIAFLLGISFNAEVDLQHVLFDLGWQTFEQGFGGLICAWVYRMQYMREKRFSH